MDPEGGAQPLYDETLATAIVANGEIYNFPVLRADLSDRHAFRTTSDRMLCAGYARPEMILPNVARWTNDRHG